jgi:predicted RNA binding protein YcfA (HicA-like mRNA interferase family)
MPKLPRIAPAKVATALARAGFDRDHQKGSHLTMRHPDGRRAVIPMHTKTVPLGTLHDIIKEAGLTVEEFQKLLK